MVTDQLVLAFQLPHNIATIFRREEEAKGASENLLHTTFPERAPVGVIIHVRGSHEYGTVIVTPDKVVDGSTVVVAVSVVPDI